MMSARRLGLVFLLSAAACSGRTSAGDPSPVDAATDFAASGCPASAPGGACRAEELGRVCRYPECPGAVVEVTCVTGTVPGKGNEWSRTSVACAPSELPDSGTRADGCPNSWEIGAQLCGTEGKVCSYDHKCPAVRFTFWCEKVADGSLHWRAREDACP